MQASSASVAGAQSNGQPLGFSGVWQKPSPQTGFLQSPGQVTLVSGLVQMPSPQPSLRPLSGAPVSLSAPMSVRLASAGPVSAALTS